ncbi:mitochondrial import receptor subunit tom-22 [Ophiostoma piceae UAMH 11346]|uniref:Mitochondrial import receptor subunit tom-22 n=1 Tax=Ophiostoma piceae (strain UAMH 11346) TaxID=1262450 RepID=S3C846_OPHP1|nr:mitochondrial import receptor subunit tom-22 [Ophiostoma piceae UAMH 11346]
MVQLVEVEDEHFTNRPIVEDDEDFSDTDSEISNDSDYNATAETFGDRLFALRDIIPPTTRGWFYNNYQLGSHVIGSTTSFLGRAAWTISVSVLLVGIPFALSWAEEQNILAMEQEQRMREMGSELLTAGAGAGGEHEDTASQVNAALGAPARPAL